MNNFDDVNISLHLAAPADSGEDDDDDLDVFESPGSKLLRMFDTYRAACQTQQSHRRFLIQMASDLAPERMRDPVRRDLRFERDSLSGRVNDWD